ncbi:MAG TPA: cyclase family protein [Candidatus Krumholzibacteria bacterium]|nr:cyclase family protein [Candidatus Krumholzibacteria bacterium]
MPTLNRPFLPRLLAVLTIIVLAAPSHAAVPDVGLSPWGPDDELGALNLMTETSRAAVLARIKGGVVYDLAVDYFIGMPSWHLLGDPRYQFWMTHTPHGTVVDDPAGVGSVQNELVSYTGDAVSFYTHMGTHIDALNHFGLNGKIYNGFRAEDHLGDRGWRKTGAETIPPIIARGVLIDVAAAKGVDQLPASYGITVTDLESALARQNLDLEPGDVVLIRGGRMNAWPDDDGYVQNQPGLTLPAARWLAEERRAMAVGGDNLSLEHFPVAEGSQTWVPVHTYLLAQAGVPIIEVVNLEELSRDRVYEFAFIAASLKLQGASAAPFRPIALPLD